MVMRQWECSQEKNINPSKKCYFRMNTPKHIINNVKELINIINFIKEIFKYYYFYF